MAEAVVSEAIQRIADLLIQEAVFLHGVRGELERLQAELKRMKCFLKDADRHHHEDERVRNWVAEIRDLAYDSEDVIDTFLLKVARGRGEGVRGFINKAFFMFTKASYLHSIGTQITSIGSKIEDINKSMQTYGIQLVEGEGSNYERQQRYRRPDPHVEEEYVNCLEAVISDLKARLMMEEEQVRVVSIVGMGGLGKTTLAKKIYNDVDVKQNFDFHSWIFISQQFSVKEVVVRILMDAASNEDKAKLLEDMKGGQPLKSKVGKMKEDEEFKCLLERMKEEDLIRTLHSTLIEKRYFVVLDDIWTTEAWDYLKRAFPNGKRGSKVLITTRNTVVASHADPQSSVVEPPLLKDDEGWELLKRKTFPRPPEFEKLGREMVKKCKGLPLAIVVLGGLLATKKSLTEWNSVHENIIAHFIKWEQHHQYGGVYGILGLSYDDLPFHLKPCFLYLSQFPEDWEFRKRELIRMWIAEGFILQPSIGGEEETMEDVGEEYLEELTSRCMVQVSERDHTGIGVKSCRLHDLIRDMCISKARSENFLGVIQHAEDAKANSSSSTLQLTSNNKWRRVAIHPRIFGKDGRKTDFYVPSLKSGDLYLRSLFYLIEPAIRKILKSGDLYLRSPFYLIEPDMRKIYGRGSVYNMTRQQARFIFENFRMLRVLKIDYIWQYDRCLPGEVGYLIHLRYLGLVGGGMTDGVKCRCVAALPSSIGNLRSLYTLDLRRNGVIILPAAVSKLECLRHLLLDGELIWQFRLDKLRHLETLKVVSAKHLIKRDTIQKLTNLRSLAVEFKTTEEVMAVIGSPIFGLGRLRSLKMRMRADIPFPNLEPLSGLHQLTKLELCGAIPEDPYSLEHLPKSLAKLILFNSKLKRDPMGILEKLSNLRVLELYYHSYEGSKMVCSAHGFPQLETLRVVDLNALELLIEEGAMPRLKNSVIQSRNTIVDSYKVHITLPANYI
ncbi:probable disease resistance protein RF9 [Manihot esculenta]|uniref:probable disease resistance protein RF9 n=1 Tax=Manihot esculenta TaxID=3983 RepID=UPI000B8E0F37|nr:probable disease resistance protein RF9 [Manihot esculenta]